MVRRVRASVGSPTIGSSRSSDSDRPRRAASLWRAGITTQKVSRLERRPGGEVGQFVDIADAEVGDAAADVLEHGGIHTLADMDLHTRPVGTIGRDDAAAAGRPPPTSRSI